MCTYVVLYWMCRSENRITYWTVAILNIIRCKTKADVRLLYTHISTVLNCISLSYAKHITLTGIHVNCNGRVIAFTKGHTYVVLKWFWTDLYGHKTWRHGVPTHWLTGQHIEVTQVNKTITDNTTMDKYTKGLRDNYTRT